MKRNNAVNNEQRQPVLFVALGYADVYDDFDQVNPMNFLQDIPTVTILKFVADRYASIFYAQTDISTQKRYIFDFCRHLPLHARKRIWSFIKKTESAGNHVFLYGSTSSMMIYRMALQSHVQLEEGDDLEILDDEYEPLFKALIYCNKLWTDQQLSKDKQKLADIVLKLDIPIVENKHYKDFRPQLYKANQFFTFCENDHTFNSYLQSFLQDKKVKTWGDYIVILFNIYSYSIKHSVLPHGNVNEQRFLSQFVIDFDDSVMKSLWDIEKNGIKYLRDHFLYALPDGNYLLLDANLLIDKIYQGIKFDFYKTIQGHGLLNANGKPFKDLPEFNSTLGTVFSEKHLLYAILENTYNGGNAVQYTGEELKQHGFDGEPDYYLRIEDTLFLIEYKDLLFPDTLRYSDDVAKIKKGILDRLCKDDDVNPRKGGGQLLYTIDKILNQGILNNMDVGITDVKHIFPLIVTTDRAFSAMGVNLTIIEEFDRILKRKYTFEQPVMIYAPVVLNIDTLISVSYRLHTASLQLSDLLLQYLTKNWKNLSSFDNFVFDEYKENSKERPAALEHLLGPMVARVTSLTCIE